jgi:carbon-monoxide dehydrogenase large subunit
MASRNIAQVSVGPYRIEHVKYAVTMVVTNKTPVGTYRGPGRFETDFFRERMLDLAALDLGIDRVEFRRRNLMPAAGIPHKLVTLFPGGDTLTDSGDYRVTLERCLELFDWEKKVLLNGRRIDDRHHGIAIACYLEGGGIGPREHARVVAQSDGRFMVHVGASGNGQGLETVMAQIAADALAVPLHRIAGVRHGSTTDTRDGFGAYSSRSTVMAGSAVHQACLDLTRALRAAAAQRLGCAEADVRVAPMPGDDDSYGQAGSTRSVRLTELLVEGPMDVEAVFSCSHRTYSYGAHAVHVAVDEGTGHVAIMDYVAVEDVGRIVNPVTLHGQTVGAVVQGLGGVFLEHLRYDRDGQLLSGTLADYLLPGASDFTSIRTEAMERFPSPHNPLGVKGAGEGGIISVGGVVANAIAAALHDHGVKPNVLPLSPERICRLMAGRPA